MRGSNSRLCLRRGFFKMSAMKGLTAAQMLTKTTYKDFSFIFFLKLSPLFIVYHITSFITTQDSQEVLHLFLYLATFRTV